jgi:hypothetical protein
MKNKIIVQDIDIKINQHNQEDFISLTDIARHKDSKRSDYILQNWMRSKDTIEFLGLWEKINNTNFNSIEFDGIKNKAGVNSFILTLKQFIYATEANLLNVALFGLTSKQWSEKNPKLEGNMRDYATAEQLVVMANLESLNAQLIKQSISFEERLFNLNEVAIEQLQLLLNYTKKVGQ